MTALLPTVAGPEEWLRAHALPLEAWLAALRALEPSFALPASTWERLAGGEDSVVCASGSSVVKLVPPFLASDAEREIGVLRRLALPVPTPRLAGVATIEGWTAIHVSRLSGTPAAEVWPTLGPAARLSVMERIGRALGASRLTRLVPEDGDAALLMPKLRERARRHEPAGFAGVDAFLDRHLPSDSHAAFVHFDLNTGNLMLGEGPDGGPVITGVLDFVASRAFQPAFDLITPGLFFAQGNPALLGAMLRTAGLGERAPAELAAWHLLHPFSDLVRDLRMCSRATSNDLGAALVDIWRAA